LVETEIDMNTEDKAEVIEEQDSANFYLNFSEPSAKLIGK